MASTGLSCRLGAKSQGPTPGQLVANAALISKPVVITPVQDGHVLEEIRSGCLGCNRCADLTLHSPKQLQSPCLSASKVLCMSAGFVGKLVCEYLVKDYRVRV